MATLIARFEGFDRSMEEAAADLGDLLAARSAAHFE